MGIFSRKSKTYVTSVAYPLGEDDGQHTPYLEYTMLNAVIQNRPIAESITQGYLRGQGISLRSAFRYARDHYTDGVPQSNMATTVVTDIEQVRTILEGIYPSVVIDIFSVKNSRADFLWWGDQYLAQNYGYDPFLENFASPPVGVDVTATVTYDISEAGDITVMMINADTSIVTETFTPVGFVSSANFLHVAFDTKTTTVVGPTTSTRSANPGEVNHTDTVVVALNPYTTQTTVTVTTIGSDLANVIALLHFDGTNASTTFTDVIGHTFTAYGNAQLDTAHPKFGIAAGKFDGAGDYISTADSADWDFGTGDFTVETFVEFSTLPVNGVYTLVSNYVSASTGWAFQFRNDGGTSRILFGWGDTDINQFAWSPSTGIKYHLAVSRVSGVIRAFVNGTQVGSANAWTTDITGVAHELWIGGLDFAGGIQWFNGWLDELRMTKGVGRYTSNFTPPTVPFGNGTATDVATVTTETKSRPKFWMYQIGLGTYPTLDSWHTGTDLVSPYYPSIPIRVNNVDFTDTAHKDTDLYKTGKKILRKVGINIKDIASSVNNNPDINEIDYCYVVFGVSLNAGSQECKRYLYRFFESLSSMSVITQADMAAWSPGTGTTAPTNVLKVYSGLNRDRHHDIEIQWQFINATTVTGSVFVGAKPGDVVIEIGTKNEVNIGWGSVLEQTPLTAKRQIDATTYEQLVISGLTYDNFVYKGKFVSISAYDAFFPAGDTTEPDEGFIIPLNYEIIRNTPMVELTDLSYQCNHLVFNCYKIVKQKWYQTGLFKIILIIVAILIIVFTWGSGTPAAAALIAEAFVTAGVAATLAIVLAATIYVLGMMILMNILSKEAIKIFGEKWGAVIAIIVSFVAMNWENIASLAGSVATNGLSSIITASTILQATTLLGSAYGAYAAGAMSELQKKSMGLWSDYDEQMKHIEELSKTNLGNNLDMIDIQGYTNATFTQLFESYDTFLSRTLLTGSDICAITAGMVSNFTEVGLALPVS